MSKSPSPILTLLAIFAIDLAALLPPVALLLSLGLLVALPQLSASLGIARWPLGALVLVPWLAVPPALLLTTGVTYAVLGGLPAAQAQRLRTILLATGGLASLPIWALVARGRFALPSPPVAAAPVIAPPPILPEPPRSTAHLAETIVDSGDEEPTVRAPHLVFPFSPGSITMLPATEWHNIPGRRGQRRGETPEA